MKLAIHTISTWNVPNLRTWCPEDDTVFAETVSLKIGARQSKRSDSFSIRVATPSGLLTLDPVKGILATSPLLVLVRYDFDVLWEWACTIVRGCEAPTWPDCVSKLSRYLSWEYDGYQED